VTIFQNQHLSSFQKVYEIYENDEKSYAGYRSLALIVPAISGRERRYHVYRLDFDRGDMLMIGCELPLETSRAVARRSRTRDLHPLTDAEVDAARWSMKKWVEVGRARWCPFPGPEIPEGEG